MGAKSGLGKGLSSLIPEDVNTAALIASGETVEELLLEALQPDDAQPRTNFDEVALQDLAVSIKRYGILQPIVVSPPRAGRYGIIAGERRWRAAQLAGLTQVPAIVRDLTDQVAIALALIENIQRQDLNPIDQAMALQRFHEEFGLSHQEIADTVGKARTTVSNLLRLLSLAEQVKDFMQQGLLDMGHARAILTLKGKDQLKVAELVIEKSLSVRQTEQYVRDLNAPKQEKSKTEIAPDLQQLTQRLTDRFSANVKIDHNKQGKGKLVISYHTLEELDGILNICLAE